jgi:lipopolysaccharide transport system permease protein
VGVGLSVLVFLSAVFYPISALPAQWEPLLRLNPLGLVIEESRAVLVRGDAPSLGYLVAGIPLAVLFSEISYRLFQKARRGFADVL